MRRTGAPASIFRRVFEQHYDAVARYCLRRLPREEVDDAVASVFTVAWRKMDDMPSIETALPWLYRIARYEVSTTQRTIRRFSALHDRLLGLAPSHQPSPDGVVVRQAEHEAVLAALRSLSTRDREVVFLRAYEELTVAEIADVVGCSRDAAAKRLGRALKRLRAGIEIPDAPRKKSAESGVISEAGEG